MQCFFDMDMERKNFLKNPPEICISLIFFKSDQSTVSRFSDQVLPLKTFRSTLVLMP